MNKIDGKPSSSPEDLPSKIFEKVIETLPNESHRMALTQSFGESDKASSSFSSIEYHLTVQLTNSSLTRRDLSLILDVLNYQAVTYGLNFNMILAMYELYFRLLGKKSDSKKIREPKIRVTVTVTELILKVFKNTDLSLYPVMFIISLVN
jgi:hypothetical protein